MLGNGPTRLKNTRREMKVKEKNTCHFSLEWKKIPAERKGANDRIIPQGGKDEREKKGGGGEEKRQGKTTGVKGDTIFYSQNKS